MRELIREKIVEATSRPGPSFTRRDVRLPEVPGKAYAVVGARRTGKTTFLWQVLSERLEEGVPREALIFLEFEDERLVGLKASELHLFLEEYYRLYPELRGRERVVFFLDEVQVVKGWEVFVRRMMDTENVEVFLSGSSARLLSREVATSMRGRALEVRIYPFSFREYLRHLGLEPCSPFGRLPKEERTQIEKLLRDYLSQGGFPESVGISAYDRVELLKSYVDVAILRDVIERHSVSHPVALRWMVRHLLGNPGGKFSINKFYRDLRSQGIPVAKDTLHAYLGHLEDAFLIRTLNISSYSERARMVNPRKVYPIDPGLIPIYARRPDAGQALETCVMLELERRGAEVSYVKTKGGYEVDFLARFPLGREELIQVCADLYEPEVREREARALLKAKEEYPHARLVLLTLDIPPHLDVPPEIEVRPVARWLLEEDGSEAP